MLAKILMGLLALMLFPVTGKAALDSDRDPRGERAYFQVVQDPIRTSRVVRGGHIVASVAAEPVAVDPLEYLVRLDYEFNILLRGPQRGARLLHFLHEVFQESFLIDLRANRHYEADFFKAEHSGFANVRNSDGRVYQHCDRVRLYDITDPSMDFLRQLLLEVAAAQYAIEGRELPETAVIENMEVWTHIQYGYPVFGAVRLDISGKTDGVDFRVGADFLPNRL